MQDHIITGRSINRSGTEWLYFAGTSYLGIPFHPEFDLLFKEGVSLFGYHFGGSRHSNLQLSVYEEVENDLAFRFGFEKSLLLSSGSLAGQVLVGQIEKEGTCIYDPHTHTALRKSTGKKSATWPQGLLEEINESEAREIFILCNSINVLQLELTNFSFLELLPEGYRYTLVIDDSHGIGLLGKNGNGIAEIIRIPANIELIVISSLAKAWGIPAGIIMGSKERIQKLYNSPLFIGSTPPAPPYCYAMLHSKKLYEERRELLMEKTQHFYHLLRNQQSFKYIEYFPVFYTPENQLFPYLYEHNILISSFSYPYPHSEPITRIVLNASHTHEDIHQLAALVNNFFEQ